MISSSTMVRFLLTAIGLGTGMTAGFFIGPAFSSGDGFEELGAAVYGALAGAPFGAVAGNLVGARISRGGESSAEGPGVGRAFLEGLGLVLGLVGGWVLSSMTGYGQSISGLMNIVALGTGVAGFAAGATLADRIPGQANHE